jgi:hypothetical protein
MMRSRFCPASMPISPDHCHIRETFAAAACQFSLSLYMRDSWPMTKHTPLS